MNNFRCNGTYDLTTLFVDVLRSCGLFPSPLQGASRRILSKVSPRNGGPFNFKISGSNDDLSENDLVESNSNGYTHFKLKSLQRL